MGKNPHPPRGGSGKKAPAAVEPPAASNSKKTKDGKTIAAAQDTAKGKKGKDAASGAVEAAEAPKKPDTRTLIGGASWTGKLPVNLLSELCQKKKWEKPDYRMYGNQDRGFEAVVKLAKKDLKTHEVTSLPPFNFPMAHKDIAKQDSALEARHFAATYTLFRLCSKQSLHLMLPPKYKDLWKGLFADLKKADEAAGKGWQYEADPFQAAEDQEKAKEAAVKKREEQAKERAKREANPQPGGGSGMGSKAWERAVDVEMGKKIRLEVEKVIRAHSTWNPHAVDMRRRLGKDHIQRAVKDLENRGFRRAHVEEAFDLCKDVEEAVEWLCTHVPEDDLPKWALPDNYIAGVAIASSDLKRDAAVKRLALAGYAKDLCEEVFDACTGDEAKAAAVLQDHLVKQEEDILSLVTQLLTLGEAGDEAWNDEKEVLLSIYGEDCSESKDGSLAIRFSPADGKLQKATLRVRRPIGDYPNVPPLISLEAALPSYIRLSITKKVLQHCEDNFLGEQMVFNLVDWLTHNIAVIIANPGRLSDISAATAIGETAVRQMDRQAHHRRPRPIDWTPGTKASIKLLEEWHARQTSSGQQKMLAKRRTLPAWHLQEAIVNAVNSHRVTIISGETGSGKSTQSVQFVLDDLIKRNFGGAANIICTQPRRISALGLADRVAEERCSSVGQEVGYIIRGESKIKAGSTRITFVTTGVLLRRLQMGAGNAADAEDALADVSHVVVDEVHERSLDTDFLLILLRDILQRRKDLKVILMSATLDAGLFANYFRSTGTVAKIEIQGRTYPVTDYYLDDVVRFTGLTDSGEDEGYQSDDTTTDSAVARHNGKAGAAIRAVGMQINYELIAQNVKHVDRELGSEEGGILIFLPGTLEIDRCIQALRSMSSLHVLPLHASLLPTEQRRVFPPAPRGKRKVIAATNVAETSITIEDIVAVIDTGRVKETSFDPRTNMVKLEEVWASQAACKQRRGRAGRVQAGTCYKLFTRSAETRMLARPDPEIRRVPLEQLCLSVKAMGINDTSSFLASALTPPDSLAVEGAITLLRRMGALDAEGYLTALGRHLSMIPADLRCGKLLVYGATFGCLEACLTIAAILSVRSPFISPRDKRDESKAARVLFGATNGANGDLIADLRAYEKWSSMRHKVARWEMQEWCSINFVSSNIMFDIASTRSQFLSSLKEIGFISAGHNQSDATSGGDSNTPLLLALIAGSFNPQIARIEFPSKKFAPSVSGAIELDPEARTIKYFIQATDSHTTPAGKQSSSERVFLHPSSTLFDAHQFAGTPHFVSYFERIATSKVFMRSVTPFGVYALLLFCGDIAIDPQGRGLLVDDYFKLKGWARIGVLASRLRVVLDTLLAKKVDDPGLDLSEHRVVAVVKRLLTFDGMDA